MFSHILKSHLVPGIIVLILGLGLFSCRTTSRLTKREIKPMTAERIIKRIEREKPDYSYLSADRANVSFEAMGTRNSVSATYKIKKDDKMIVSLKKMGFPIGRGLLCPDSVIAINFIDRNYVSGDYKAIKKLFGFELDYTLLQALLTADVSSYLNNKEFEREFTSVVDQQLYRLDSQFDKKIERAISRQQEQRLSRYMDDMDDNAFFDIHAWIDPEFFVIRKLELNNIKTGKKITILYDSYELSGRELFPTIINLDYSEKDRNIQVQIKTGKLSTQKVNDFSFPIPEKYEKFND